MNEEQEFLIKLAGILTKNNITVATAESCSGGLLGNMLTNVSGSSSYFDRGVISYSNQAKIDLLGVSVDLLKTYGAVSAEVAEAMAKGIQLKAKVTMGIATTGIAGPTGGSEEKPVGLVYIGCASPEEAVVEKHHFLGNRFEIKQQTCHEALQLLYKQINSLC